MNRSQFAAQQKQKHSSTTILQRETIIAMKITNYLNMKQSHSLADMEAEVETELTGSVLPVPAVWTFWDGNPPDLVLRCIESMRLKNPNRPVVVVSKATLSQFLEPEDYPLFHGRQGTPEDFSCAQYLSDWVRLTLLEKYGGIWFDASVICTNNVDSWLSPETSKITMFPMHANSNIHGNWAMAAVSPGHPLVKAWRQELSAVYNETGPGKVPTQYIDRAFEEHPALVELWNDPTPPPLPYLWVYLALQVVLQKNPTLHSTIHLRPSIDGPMYRRYLFNIRQGIADSAELSNATANHLATEPLNLREHDRYFVKLVGSDRAPCQIILDKVSFERGSALDTVQQIRPRRISYGKNLQVAVKLERRTQFQAAVRAVLAAKYIAGSTDGGDCDCYKADPALQMHSQSSLISGMKPRRASKITSE
jgi:mannosyltransferase OCH1-like enzyme